MPQHDRQRSTPPSRPPSPPAGPHRTSLATTTWPHPRLTPPPSAKAGWSRPASPRCAGRIDREALDAALAWRGWFETVTPFRAQPWDIRVDASAGLPNDTSMILRVNAAAKLRAVADALGPLRVKLLESVVVKDLSWLELGRVLRVSGKTAQGFAVEAIEALADWHAGRAAAAPPVLRFRNQPGRL